MAIRNMMQMKQSGFNAKLRDDIDDVYLKFDYSEPNEEEVAAQEAAMAQEQGGGQAPVQKMGEFEVFKRDVTDSVHGSVPDASAMVSTRGSTIRPLREGGIAQTRGGQTKKNERIIHNEGSPISSKGNKDTDKTSSEKIADAKLKRLNIDGQRGQSDE